MIRAEALERFALAVCLCAPNRAGARRLFFSRFPLARLLWRHPRTPRPRHAGRPRSDAQVGLRTPRTSRSTRIRRRRATKARHNK